MATCARCSTTSHNTYLPDDLDRVIAVAVTRLAA